MRRLCGYLGATARRWVRGSEAWTGCCTHSCLQCLVQSAVQLRLTGAHSSKCPSLPYQNKRLFVRRKLRKCKKKTQNTKKKPPSKIPFIVICEHPKRCNRFSTTFKLRSMIFSFFCQLFFFIPLYQAFILLNISRHRFFLSFDKNCENYHSFCLVCSTIEMIIRTMT